MMVFWILAAGLIGLALLFIVPPILLRRSRVSQVDENQVNLELFRQQLEELDADLATGNLDQTQYDAARRDLEKELLLDIDPDAASAAVPERSGRWAAAALGAAVPALAVVLYLGVGDPAALQQTGAGSAASPHQAGGKNNMPPMDELVDKLAKRLETDPDNVEGWVMLARSYLAMERTEEAVKAYEKANALAPDEPVILLGLAEAVIRIQRSMAGRPEELIAQALELEPGNPNGLWMMGLHRFQQEEFAAAVDNWSRLLPQLQPGSEDAQMLQGYIQEAKSRGGLESDEPAAVATGQPAVKTGQPPEPPQPAADGASIQVAVSLAPELADQAAPDDTLFVFARAAAGPPMPLAVQRFQVKDLPVSAELNDGMAMMPQMRLSAFDQVVVGARISKSGNAMPQSGDLQGETAPITPAATKTISIVIDGVHP